MSDHTVSELLKILGGGSSEPKPSEQPTELTSELSDFINKFNLEKSVDKIPTTVIYYTYKEVYGGKLSKIGFFKKFSKHFDQVRHGKQRYYRVSGDFDLSREGLIRVDFFNKGE